MHDVSAFDDTTPLVVIARYEGGVFVLCPAGIPGIEVKRRLDADSHMVWTRPDRGGLVVTLERDGDGAGTPPNTFFPYQPNAQEEERRRFLHSNCQFRSVARRSTEVRRCRCRS